jgi:hypothetical protein
MKDTKTLFGFSKFSRAWKTICLKFINCLNTGFPKKCLQTLFLSFQSLPVPPSDGSNMEMKTLEWLKLVA